MRNPYETYWVIRLKKCRNALEKNNFEAYSVDDLKDAERLVLEELIPGLNPKTVSWGGSQTIGLSGIFDHLKSNPEIKYVIGLYGIINKGIIENA